MRRRLGRWCLWLEPADRADEEFGRADAVPELSADPDLD
jgi:hypothetical protein